jgi:hypothetical protein
VAEDVEEEEVVVVEEPEARNTTLVLNTIFTSGDASKPRGVHVATPSIAFSSDGRCGRPVRFGLRIRTRLEADFAMITWVPDSSKYWLLHTRLSLVQLHTRHTCADIRASIQALFNEAKIELWHCRHTEDAKNATRSDYG